MLRHCIDKKPSSRGSGVDLPRATMASWIIKLGECVVPIINLLNEQLLESALIQCDETRVQRFIDISFGLNDCNARP